MQRLGLGILVVVAGVFGPVAAQQMRPVLTADDYVRAEKFMAYNTDALVSGALVLWCSGAPVLWCT
jgi:hypothetical protein